MVSGLAFSKNKMKSLKANTKSKHIRYRASKDRSSKSPKMESTSDGKNVNTEIKVKSGSWKRKRNSECNETERTSPSPSQFRPGILYSDVVFSGENPSTLVRVRGPTPDQADNHVQIPKTRSKNRKRTPNSTKNDKTNCCSDLMPLEKMDKGEDNAVPMMNLNDLAECTQRLMKALNIEIPSWNATDFGTFNDIPKFVCQFDDYNYLACEKVAFVGLRLASDGKFKF